MGNFAPIIIITTYLRKYGTQLHLDSLLPHSIRHCHRAAGVYGRHRGISSHYELHVRHVEDSVRDLTRTHRRALAVARHNEDWREGRRHKRCGARAVARVHTSVSRHSEGSSRHGQHLHECGCQHAGTRQRCHSARTEGYGTTAGAESEEGHRHQSDDYVPRAQHVGTHLDSRQYHGVSCANGGGTTYRHLRAHSSRHVLLYTGGHRLHLALPAHQSHQPYNAAHARRHVGCGGCYNMGLRTDGQGADERCEQFGG